jgi:Fe2+ transport system protein FeoA
MEYLYRVHAIKRMFERKISEQEIEAIVERGETIESYPDDIPYASRLMMGFIDGKPIHVVCSTDELGRTIIITVYRPDPKKWDKNYRKRRQ